jgi:hypothetical protein
VGASPAAAMDVNAATHSILLIVNSSASNKFGAYLGEILRAEGLNSFDQAELSSLTATQLNQHDLAILAETSLSSAQASMLTTYVSGGGALLAMRPDAQITGVFGLSTKVGTLSGGYLQIKTSAVYSSSVPGSGLVAATLQIHGPADEYTLGSGGVMLAQLYSNATTSTSYPAVVGATNASGGMAVAFTYDLASNVAYTRQGNPANANLDLDGDYYARTVDLFQTAGGGAPWIDRSKIPIPQADEQQRLFARLVQQMIGRLHPMPQLWYFPGTAKTMLILTSDAHWNNASDDFPKFIADLNDHQGQVTMYLGPDGDWPENGTLQAWRAQGHTFGIHPYRVDGSTLTAGFNTIDSLFSSTYTIPRSNTVRIHRYEWEGWTSAADIEAAHNIALDVSFAAWGAWLQKSDNTWPHGYMTGSGLPMKFVGANGTLSPVYQQLTTLTDDQLLTPQNGAEGLTGSEAVAVSKGLIDASLAGYYSALTELHHVDFYASEPDLQTWLKGSVDYAVNKGVPIWNADTWLGFTQLRHDANYNNIAWNASTGVLSFAIAMTTSPGLTPTTILPLSYGGQALRSVAVDGRTITYTVQTIKSTNVAFVSMPGGNHSVSAVYGASGKLPQTITVVNHAPASAAYGARFTVSATASSGLAVTYSASGVCTNTGSTFTLTSGTGTCTVQYDQAGNGSYYAAPQVTESVTAQKVDQTITVINHAPATAAYGTSFTVMAAASSGLAVAYRASGVCTNTGNTFTLTSGTGSCAVQYNQGGNVNYNAATPVTEAVTAQKAAQTISVASHAPASAAFGASFTVTATASSGLAVTYSASGVCTNVGNNFTMTSASGTCTVQYDRAGNANYNAATQVTEAVTAQKAAQTITVVNDAPATARYGARFTVTATASSGLAVTYSASGVCTNVGNNFTMTSGTGSCTVRYDQAGNANYGAATQVTETATAQKAAQTITVVNNAPATATYGASFTVTAAASSGLAVAYSASGVCTDVGNTFTMRSGAGTCMVQYDQAGNANYNVAAQVTETVTARKMNQTIAFGTLPDRAVGDLPFTVTGSASSRLTVTFTASGPCRVASNMVILTGAVGTCTVTAHQAGDVNYSAAPDVPQSFKIAFKIYLPFIRRSG